MESKDRGSTASMIVSSVCNEHKNSDLRADHPDILRAFNERFDVLDSRVEAASEARVKVLTEHLRHAVYKDHLYMDACEDCQSGLTALLASPTSPAEPGTPRIMRGPADEHPYSPHHLLHEEMPSCAGSLPERMHCQPEPGAASGEADTDVEMTTGQLAEQFTRLTQAGVLVPCEEEPEHAVFVLDGTASGEAGA